jgi:predicted kinase
MEAILLMGVQASGKSSFYRERFFRTHMRLNLDMLKNRNREWRLFEACLDTNTRFVLDNTSPTRAERQSFIAAAKARRFQVIGYYFQSRVELCKTRNDLRAASEQVPLPGASGNVRAAGIAELGRGVRQTLLRATLGRRPRRRGLAARLRSN